MPHSRYTVQERDRLRAELRERVARGERFCATARAMGIPQATADRWIRQEHRIRNKHRTANPIEGYSTWSDSARERWDRYWARPDAQERLAAFLDDERSADDLRIIGTVRKVTA